MYVEVAIIGGGPAGISCGLQLKRSGVDVCIIEKEALGGLLWNAGMIENYPGFPSGIPAKSLIRKLTGHIRNSGIEIIPAEARSVSYRGNRFHILLDKGEITADFLVVASGTIPVTWDEFKTEPEYSGRIFYGTAQMREIRNRMIAVIGAGDAAFDYAIQMAGQDNRVMIFNRSSRSRCLLVLQKRIEKIPLIGYQTLHQLTAINFLSDRMKLQMVFETGDGETRYLADYIIFATGRKPATDFLPEEWQALMNAPSNEIPLFFAGDVRNERFRQASIAAGEGIRTAMQISSIISKSN